MGSLLEILFWIPLAIVFYSYIIYPVAVKILADIFASKLRFSSEHKPTVGILIPAYNEELVIRKKIVNAFNIDYPSDKISVWVGSDQSSDATNDIVAKMIEEDPRIHLWVSPERGGKTQVVNQLTPLIDAELILLTDANTMHDRDCLNKMVGYFTDSSVGGVAGRIGHIAEDNNEELSENLYRNFEVNQKINESRLHSCISAFGGFYIIRKSLFKAIPYNAYSNDDVLIPMNIVRSGQRMIFEPLAISEEDLTCDLQTEYKRRVRIGAGNYQSFTWLLDFLDPRQGWPAFCYISHKAIRWYSAILLLISTISLFMLTLFSVAPLYTVLFVFSALAGVGTIVGHVGLGIQKLRPAFYFLIMNIALIHGFVRFSKGIKSAAWSPTDRTETHK